LIQFYAAAVPSGDDIKLNCYSNVAVLQGQFDSSITNGGIDGFVINTATTVDPNEFPLVKRTVLDFTFTSNVVNFAGFDGTDPLAPTVEFCVKVTLGDVQYKELALKYSINLNGNIDESDALLLDAEVAADEETSVSYTATAYVCDENGDVIDPTVTVTQGNTVFVCVESDSAEAPVTSIQDLRLVATAATQVLYNSNSVQRLARSVNDCAGGKCIVEVFPGVDFFAALSADTSQVCTLTGVAVLGLGSLPVRTRHLLTGKTNPRRDLQDQTGEVSGTFDAIAGDDKSGAATNGCAFLTMLGVMAAAALAF
jgi:hypothetical protein